MTPERIEEIKRRAERYVESPTADVFELLAALEEAQQTATLAYAAYEDLKESCVSRGEYDSLLNKHTVLAKILKMRGESK